MYRKDSLNELEADIKKSNFNNIQLYPKLVRGAYLNLEYGESHLFNNKKDTDDSYNKGILLCYKNNIKAMLATHNEFSINLGLLLNQDKNLFIFANLLGMNEKKINKIKDCSKATYIPYGPYNEMIPYMVRRLYENLESIKYISK
jgi:proline dehydrogenase